MNNRLILNKKNIIYAFFYENIKLKNLKNTRNIFKIKYIYSFYFLFNNIICFSDIFCKIKIHFLKKEMRKIKIGKSISKHFNTHI